MDAANNGGSIPSSVLSRQGIKKYVCPHCDRFLFNGNVQFLKMVCPHCLTMIDASDEELFKTGTDAKQDTEV